MELDAKISSDEVLAKHPRAKVLKEMHGERALAGVQTTKTTQSQQQLNLENLTTVLKMKA